MTRLLFFRFARQRYGLEPACVEPAGGDAALTQDRAVGPLRGVAALLRQKAGARAEDRRNIARRPRARAARTKTIGDGRREFDIKRFSWLDTLATATGEAQALTPPARQSLSRLDETMFDVWNLGENIILAWTREDRELRFLAVRHYAIIETMDAGPAAPGHVSGAFINGILAGPKFVPPAEFDRVCRVLGTASRVYRMAIAPAEHPGDALVTRLVARYGVSLVHERAVVLLDAVGFSLRSPLDQVAMLNSLSYSVNSAYRQLISRNVEINFARTSTGDGFYIWNRARTLDANIALYKLMMLILTDNAVAQRKAKRFPVPTLRAAFHVGEHYEFYQVEALNPTTFSYIVGQVTIELSRMIEHALPGQILLGDFNIEVNSGGARGVTRCGTLDFVAKTSATLNQLSGLMVARNRIKDIRCYLTGAAVSGEDFRVCRYQIRDKHGVSRTVYNAKINIHRRRAEPVFLGIQHKDLHPHGMIGPAWPGTDA